MPIIPGGHDFQFERRPITGGWDTGMWCSMCDSRMNQAPEVCPGRKGFFPERQTVWDRKCLYEVINFIDAEMEKRKAA